MPSALPQQLLRAGLRIVPPMEVERDEDEFRFGSPPDRVVRGFLVWTPDHGVEILARLQGGPALLVGNTGFDSTRRVEAAEKWQILVNLADREPRGGIPVWRGYGRGSVEVRHCGHSYTVVKPARLSPSVEIQFVVEGTAP